MEIVNAYPALHLELGAWSTKKKSLCYPQITDLQVIELTTFIATKRYPSMFRPTDATLIQCSRERQFMPTKVTANRGILTCRCHSKDLGPPQSGSEQPTRIENVLRVELLFKFLHQSPGGLGSSQQRQFALPGIVAEENHEVSACFTGEGS